MTNLPGSEGRPHDEPLLTIPELADWLSVSEHTVNKWCTCGPASGKIPRMIRINGVLRFRPEDVRDWLETKAVN